MQLSKKDKADLFRMIKHFRKSSELQMQTTLKEKYDRYCEVLNTIIICHKDIDCEKCGCNELLCGHNRRE